jgi:hypothetical protein
MPKLKLNKSNIEKPSSDLDKQALYTIQSREVLFLIYLMGEKLVPAEGFEPPTFGLQNRCTTPVLSRRDERWGR